MFADEIECKAHFGFVLKLDKNSESGRQATNTQHVRITKLLALYAKYNGRPGLMLSSKNIILFALWCNFCKLDFSEFFPSG